MTGEQRPTDAELLAHAERQRAEQGLPPRIEDVATLTRIATIMRLGEPEPKRRKSRT